MTHPVAVAAERIAAGEKRVRILEVELGLCLSSTAWVNVARMCVNPLPDAEDKLHSAIQTLGIPVLPRAARIVVRTAGEEKYQVHKTSTATS